MWRRRWRAERSRNRIIACLDDREINRLAGVTTLETDAAFTEAYPGAQGSEVIVSFEGRTARSRMDDVIPATPEHNSRAVSIRVWEFAGHRRNHRYTGTTGRRRRLRRLVSVKKHQMLIGGKWVDPASGEWFESVNPFTAQTVGADSARHQGRRRQGGCGCQMRVSRRLAQADRIGARRAAAQTGGLDRGRGAASWPRSNPRTMAN